MSNPTTVRVDVDSCGVALITLDGPERLNAFGGETARQLGEAYRRCDADDAVRAVVVTGAGRAFCAGADMSEQAAVSPSTPTLPRSPTASGCCGVRRMRTRWRRRRLRCT
ncbi:enoyl-CoA hydratase-related protein [Mycolicibacterium sarraceniae]|uniref:enoyl-CoA hydratase-related protein n=1 Tax=Mycolicibacterium sarraceniae TaxID=1534348 RepID=UPI0038994FB3